jgi:YD repeat-containing protein
VGTTLSYRIAAVDANGVETGQWETGEGTWRGSDLFERTTPKAGSSSLPVAFADGTKKVTFTINAADLAGLLALSGTATLAWNADNTLASITSNGVTYTMGYTTVDDFPRLTTITGGGETTTLGYDAQGRVTSIS